MGQVPDRGEVLSCYLKAKLLLSAFKGGGWLLSAGRTGPHCLVGKLPGTRRGTAGRGRPGAGGPRGGPLPALVGVSLSNTPHNVLASSLRRRRDPDTSHPHLGHRHTAHVVTDASRQYCVTCDDAHTLTLRHAALCPGAPTGAQAPPHSSTFSQNSHPKRSQTRALTLHACA